MQRFAHDSRSVGRPYDPVPTSRLSNRAAAPTASSVHGAQRKRSRRRSKVPGRAFKARTQITGVNRLRISRSRIFAGRRRGPAWPRQTTKWAIRPLVFDGVLPEDFAGCSGCEGSSGLLLIAIVPAIPCVRRARSPKNRAVPVCTVVPHLTKAPCRSNATYFPPAPHPRPGGKRGQKSVRGF